MNITKFLQQQLGFRPLNKIDPNTQQPAKEKQDGFEVSGALGQAAVPAVLTAMYKKSRTPEGTEEMMNSTNATSLLNSLFNNRLEEVVARISEFAGVSKDDAVEELERITATALLLVRKNTNGKVDHNAVSSFLNAQSSNIFPYLPPALHLGEILKDDTVDDNSNKMQGPMSNLMHNLEKGFSQGKK